MNTLLLRGTFLLCIIVASTESMFTKYYPTLRERPWFHILEILRNSSAHANVRGVTKRVDAEEQGTLYESTRCENLSSIMLHVVVMC